MYPIAGINRPVNSSSLSSRSLLATLSSSESSVPLFFGVKNLLRAFCLSGFLSSSRYADAIDDVTTPDIKEEHIDFRDFCHGLAMYVVVLKLLLLCRVLY